MFKKTYLYLIINLITLLILFWPLLKFDFFESMDGELHLGRVGVYTQELKQGQFPVRWSGILNYGYGSPIFNFVYPLPYIFPSLLHLLGFNLVLSLKITIIVAWILSGWFMYMAMLRWTGSKNGAWISSLIYMLLPYRILDVYVRFALGEHVAFIFPPLIWYGFVSWQKNKNYHNLSLIVLSSAGLVLAHNALAIMFLPALALLMLCESHGDRIKNVLSAWVGLAWGLALSAFFWLPSLYEMKYTLTRIYLADKNFHDYFLNLKQLIWQPWSFSNKATPVYLGITSLIIISIALIKAIKQKDKRLTLQLVLLTIIIWLMTSASTFVWEKIPIIQYFQTPWRFLAMTVFSISVIAAYLLKNTKKMSMLLILIISVLIIETLPNIKVLSPMKVNEDYFNSYPLSTTWHHEGAPVWTAGEATNFPLSRYELIGKGEISVLHETSTDKIINVNSLNDSRIIFHHYYFPGWKVKINSDEIPIQFQDINYRGLITFDVPKGEHIINIKFNKTKIRILSELVSLAAIIGVIIFYRLTNINRVKK